MSAKSPKKPKLSGSDKKSNSFLVSRKDKKQCKTVGDSRTNTKSGKWLNVSETNKRQKINYQNVGNKKSIISGDGAKKVRNKNNKCNVSKDYLMLN